MKSTTSDGQSVLEEKLLNKPETARYLGISVETLDRLHRKGTGPKRYHVGQQCRYRLAGILDWLESQAAA